MVQHGFRCAKCECRTLEEVLLHVVQSTSFEKVEREEGITEPVYLNTSTEGGELDRFQCQGCGDVLKDPQGGTIRDAGELWRWLKTHGEKTAPDSRA